MNSSRASVYMNSARASLYTRRSQGTTNQVDFEDDEIIQSFSVFQIPITKADIERPTVDIMLIVMERLDDFLVGVTPEAINDRIQTLINEEEGVTAEMGALIFQATMMHAFIDLVRMSGLPEYSMANVLKPDSTSFRAMAHAVIDYARFRDDHTEVADVLQDLEQFVANATDIDERVQQARAVNATTKQELNNQPHKLGNLEAFNSLLSQEILAKKEKVDQLQKVREEYHQEKAALAEEYELRQTELRQIETDIREMSAYSEIDIDAETREVAALEAEIARLDSEIVASDSRRQRAISMFRSLQECHRQFGRVEQEIDEYRSVATDVESAREELRAQENELRQLQIEQMKEDETLKRTERNLASVKEKQKRFEQQYEAKEKTANDLLVQEESQDDKLQSQLEDDQREINELNREIISVRERIQNDEKNHNQRLHELKELTETLVRDIEQRWITGSEDFEQRVNEMFAPSTSAVAVNEETNS